MKTYFKPFILSALSIFFYSLTNAQVHGDFENWDSTGTFFRNFSAHGWMDVVNQNCAQENKEWSVTRTTDARSGQYAIQLKNIALSNSSQPATLMTSSDDGSMFNNKIPVNARHPKLEGYYKYSTSDKDTFSIMVLMMKGEDFVGMGEYKQSAQKSEYTKFSVPVIYSSAAGIIPDSAVIMITAGSSDNFQEGTTLILDDLSFGVTSGLIDRGRSFEAEVNIWPNPATERVNVSLSGSLKGNVRIELVNVMGQTVKEVSGEAAANTMEVSFDLAGTESGIMFLRISDENGTKGFRILHQ